MVGFEFVDTNTIIKTIYCYLKKSKIIGFCSDFDDFLNVTFLFAIVDRLNAVS